jgi:hypothetical protein
VTIKHVGGTFEHLRTDVRVNVRRRMDARMPESARHNREVHASLD